ncbi:hypothetical protein [Novosphingobium sp. HII-3]|uniref:hypothetical protein n=1 Tax=Novosphingobium sp. HII-3 TaxID=2075565 RepID=UPI000CDA7029|nr:hypothetical protein [Novosphingobium sp. HII-3]
MRTLHLQRDVPLKTTGQAFLAASLRVSGWLLVNAMIALGVLALAVLAIGSFSIEGAMHHLANLASRYIVAGPDRQHQFDLILLWSAALVFVAAGIFRRHSLMRALFEETSHD